MSCPITGLSNNTSYGKTFNDLLQESFNMDGCQSFTILVIQHETMIHKRGEKEKDH